METWAELLFIYVCPKQWCHYCHHRPVMQRGLRGLTREKHFFSHLRVNLGLYKKMLQGGSSFQAISMKLLDTTMSKYYIYKVFYSFWEWDDKQQLIWFLRINKLTMLLAGTMLTWTFSELDIALGHWAWVTVYVFNSCEHLIIIIFFIIIIIKGLKYLQSRWQHAISTRKDEYKSLYLGSPVNSLNIANNTVIIWQCFKVSCSCIGEWTYHGFYWYCLAYVNMYHGIGNNVMYNTCLSVS